MHAWDSLREVPTLLRRSPAILIPTGGFGLLQVLLIVFLTGLPFCVGTLAVALITAILFVPWSFLQAGVLGLADEATEREAEIHTFLESGASNFRLLFEANAVLVGAVAIAGAVFAAGSLLDGFIAYGTSGPVLLSVIAIALIALGALMAIPLFFIQFYGQAVVLQDASVVASLLTSVTVVRRNLASTVGFTATFGLLIGCGGYASLRIASEIVTLLNCTSGFENQPPDLSMFLSPLMIGFSILYAALTAVWGGALSIFAVSFYKEIYDDE